MRTRVVGECTSTTTRDNMDSRRRVLLHLRRLSKHLIAALPPCPHRFASGMKNGCPPSVHGV